MNTKTTTKRLTDGKPISLILGFSIPVLIGCLFQQFYSLVDTVIVSKYLGVDALAAVGSTGSLNFLIIGFCMGVCGGFAVPIAQRFGAGDEDGVQRFVTHSVWLSLAFSIVMTVTVGIFCKDILVLMQTPADIMKQSYDYIFIIFMGIPIVFLYNVSAGIMRSLGDSKTPVYFLLISSALNIVLDIYFIKELGMNVEGAGYATVISQGVSGVLCLIYMILKFPILRVKRDQWRLTKKYSVILLSMGFPMGLQYTITALGCVILQASVNTLGSGALASIAASNKIGMFIVCPFDALGTTMATYGGQNIGANKIKRLNDGFKAATLLGGIYSVISILIVLFLGNFLFSFIDASEVTIINDARYYLLLQAVFYFPLAIVNIARFLIQGIGYTNLAVLAGVCELIARAAAAYLLVPVIGFTGAALASPIAWLMADAFLVPAFYHIYKKLNQAQKRTS